MLLSELCFPKPSIWLKDFTQESKRAKAFVNIPFVDAVVLCGHMMIALKVMAYIGRQSFVHMYQVSVVVIIGQGAMVFCLKLLNWHLIEKSFSTDDLLLC